MAEVIQLPPPLTREQRLERALVRVVDAYLFETQQQLFDAISEGIPLLAETDARPVELPTRWMCELDCGTVFEGMGDPPTLTEYLTCPNGRRDTDTTCSVRRVWWKERR